MKRRKLRTLRITRRDRKSDERSGSALVASLFVTITLTAAGMVVYAVS